jgi:hypothetical protein
VALLADVLRPPPEPPPPEPEPAPTPPRYTIQPRGYGGWHDVLDAAGQPVNNRAVQRAEADALLQDLTHE